MGTEAALLSSLTTELTDALRAFAATERGIVQTNPQADTEKAYLLVQLRRQLVLDFARTGAALEVEPRLTESPALMSDAMRQLAAFRTANAINQADWPAVRVRDNAVDYRIASQRVAEASRRFWAWVEQQLNFRP